MSIFNIINETKLIPLTTLTSRDDVEPLCEVLSEVSIPLIEITLRDERTLNIIDEFKKFLDIFPAKYPMPTALPSQGSEWIRVTSPP